MTTVGYVGDVSFAETERGVRVTMAVSRIQLPVVRLLERQVREGVREAIQRGLPVDLEGIPRGITEDDIREIIDSPERRP